MSGGSMFGGSTAFGASSPQQQQNPSSIFGGGGAVGGFGQSANNAAPAFGAPSSPSSGFGLSALAASANPTFGSSPQFGSAPSFGSPKSGFGSFANANTNSSFSSPQKNALFETLGASDNAMTFGKFRF